MSIVQQNALYNRKRLREEGGGENERFMFYLCTFNPPWEVPHRPCNGREVDSLFTVRSLLDN